MTTRSLLTAEQSTTVWWLRGEDHLLWLLRRIVPFLFLWVRVWLTECCILLLLSRELLVVSWWLRLRACCCLTSLEGGLMLMRRRGHSSLLVTMEYGVVGAGCWKLLGWYMISFLLLSLSAEGIMIKEEVQRVLKSKMMSISIITPMLLAEIAVLRSAAEMISSTILVLRTMAESYDWEHGWVHNHSNSLRTQD